MAAESQRYQTEGTMKVTLTWTSDGSGNASVVTPPLHGMLVRVVVDPGSAAPTDDYDMTLLDEFGLDLMAGIGGNCDTTTSEHFCPSLPMTDGVTTSTTPICCAGPATLSVSNAGSAKSGTVVLFLV